MVIMVINTPKVYLKPPQTVIPYVRAKRKIREVRTKINADNTRMFASITIDISDIKQFYDIKRNLNAIEDVYSVSRVSLGLEK